MASCDFFQNHRVRDQELVRSGVRGVGGFGGGVAGSGVAAGWTCVERMVIGTQQMLRYESDRENCGDRVLDNTARMFQDIGNNRGQLQCFSVVHDARHHFSCNGIEATHAS